MRSHYLWQSVNQAIASIIEDAVRLKHSRQRVATRLLRMAGPKEPGEPAVVESYRSAAKQIAGSKDRLTLI